MRVPKRFDQLLLGALLVAAGVWGLCANPDVAPATGWNVGVIGSRLSAPGPTAAQAAAYVGILVGLKLVLSAGMGAIAMHGRKKSRGI